MAFKKVAEISIDKLEDRKTVTAILHANGYTVGPGKRKKTPTGKQLDYDCEQQWQRLLHVRVACVYVRPACCVICIIN